jgi:hypothetical protein
MSSTDTEFPPELKTLTNIPVTPDRAPAPGSGPTPPPASKAPQRPASRPDSQARAPADAPLSGGVSVVHRTMLAVALPLGTVGAALPVLLIAWLLLALLATGVTAVALERTGGLMPTTFGGGYWLALGIDGAVLLWSLVRRIRRRPAPWRPLVVLVVVYALVLWILVPLDVRGFVNIPDVLTALALLGASTLVVYLLPWALLALLGQGLALAWRAGRAAPAVAARITAVAGCLGIAGLSVAGAATLAGHWGHVDALRAQLGGVGAVMAGGVEEARQSYEDLAWTLGAAPPAPGAPDTTMHRHAFVACAEALAGAQEDGRPAVEAATASLIRGGLTKPDAEDAAMHTLLQVCQEQGPDRGDDLVAQYRKALRQVSASLAGTPAALDVVRAAYDRLGPVEQRLLSMRYIDGMGHDQIGLRLHRSEADVQAQAGRALDRLRWAWEQGRTSDR